MDPRRKVFGGGTVSHGEGVGERLEEGVEQENKSGEECREGDASEQELGIPQR